jgi:N-acetylmuramoyl-L-alanine amidase
MGGPRRVRMMALVALSILLSCGASNAASGESAGARLIRSGTSNCNHSEFRVILDVGHTVERYGVLSARGATEYAFNLRLANRIEERLVDAGFGKTLVLVTTTPPPRGLFERAARANGLRADLFLSIHHDGVPDSFVEKWEYDGREHSFSDRFNGHSIFISSHNGDPTGSLRFGRLLGNQLQARGLQYTRHYTEEFMGNRRRELVDADAGVYRYDELIVLRTTRMPAVLLEAGSIVNRDEELLLQTPERQTSIAAAVTDAVDAFCAMGRRDASAQRIRDASLVRQGPHANGGDWPVQSITSSARASSIGGEKQDAAKDIGRSVFHHPAYSILAARSGSYHQVSGMPAK